MALPVESCVSVVVVHLDTNTQRGSEEQALLVPKRRKNSKIIPQFYPNCKFVFVFLVILK